MANKYAGEYLRKAHTYSINNKEPLKQDEICGCFSCCTIFHTNEIKNYIRTEEGTALCPYCYADAIIGAYSGYPITREFLEEMNEQWMNGDKEPCWEML